MSILHVFSQDNNDLILIEVGAKFVNVYSSGGGENTRFGKQGDLFEGYDDFENNWGVPEYVNYIAWVVNINKKYSISINLNVLTSFKLSGDYKGKYSYTSADILVRNYFLEKKDQKNNTRGRTSNNKKNSFKPYILAGNGFNLIDGVGFNTLVGGLGANYWINKKVGLFLSSTYNYSFSSYGASSLQNNIGIIFKSIGINDTDKDGVRNKFDECPETFGLRKFNGCPDKDNDNVPDYADICPETKGSISNSGCPDTDKDGLHDLEDACPNQYGLIELEGCPDTDRDGIIDSQDECPKKFGTIKNKGCPVVENEIEQIINKEKQPTKIVEKEGDLPIIKDTLRVIERKVNEPIVADSLKVVEKEINVPTVVDTIKTVKRYINIPTIIDTLTVVEKKQAEAVIPKKEKLSFTIFFDYDSDIVHNTKKNNEILEKIKLLITQKKEATILIEGHASARGDALYNKNLSERRALAIKQKLIALGIKEIIVKIESFGDTQLKYFNEFSFKNRRVKITVQE